MAMNPFLFWLTSPVGIFPLAAVLMVMLGQPVRPLGHLLKASGFWTLIIWVILAVALVAL
jgi:hypothetical protein